MLGLSRVVLTASSLILMLTGQGVAGDIVRHSGTIVAIDEKTDSIVVEELGPWHGKTVVMALRILIAPNAPIMVARRSANAPSGFVGDYVEEPLAPWGLAPGDFVTVECRHVGKRLIGVKITVADISKTAAPEPSIEPPRRHPLSLSGQVAIASR